MNSENSKTSELPRLVLNYKNKINLKICDKDVALSNFSNYYTWRNIERSYKNNKFKISAPTVNDKLELSHRSYYVSNIADPFDYIIKKTGKTD